jgi:hypothetical protein
MTTPVQAIIRELEEYLLAHGFSGDIPQNNGHKNWLAIKRLVKGDSFYTFGIKRIEDAAHNHEISAKQIRDIMIESSGITIQRFSHKGAGHFSSGIVSQQLIKAIVDIKRLAQEGKTIAFATGHPGAMTGLMNELALWAENLGAKIAVTEYSLVVDGRLRLDMIGRVLLPSDNCSAAHSHDFKMMEKFLELHPTDLVVADHGFAGAALNLEIPTIGFYDTDDPALPLARYLSLPILAVPINDNCYNADGAALARYLIERFGQHVAAKPRRSRARTH